MNLKNGKIWNISLLMIGMRNKHKFDFDWYSHHENKIQYFFGMDKFKQSIEQSRLVNIISKQY